MKRIITQAKLLQKSTVKKMHTYNYIGLWGAVIFYSLSHLPSLLPRVWYLQALLGGLSIAVGYGIGVFSAVVARWSIEQNKARKPSPKSWKLFYIFAPLIVIAASLSGWHWQADVRSLMNLEDEVDAYFLRALLLSIFIGWGLVAISRVIRKLFTWIHTKLSIKLPFRVSVIVALLVTYSVIIWVASGVFFTFFITQADRFFSYQNQETPAGIEQPDSIYKSGSSESIISWESIGRQGRAFVGSGPSADKIQGYSGRKSLEPIRIYVGVDDKLNARDQADIAVEELKRTNAFEREFLIIAIPTGTGWIEPKTMNTLEYLHLGDTATVAIQYSYLPSWLSFLVDQERARIAGVELFDAVYDEWRQLPENSRPTLLSFGLSLGSFGGQAAFSSGRDMLRAIDGALYQGTPNDTALWREITDRRDAPSPEWQPVYNNGDSIRFASSNQDISKWKYSWESETKILYMQHASDPVVWFSFDLIHNKPDWLNEPRGPDVSSAVQWYPFVTFLQVAVDQMIGNSVPVGHGHLYENTAVNSWAAITHSNDWTDEEIEKLQTYILENP